VCEHLIGRNYEYGGDDCIHLVVDALKALGKNPPAVADHWYKLSPRGILRELTLYCDTLDAPPTMVTSFCSAPSHLNSESNGRVEFCS
jgi:hypothetical protein